MQLSIIIVTYNSKNFIIKCLKSIIKFLNKEVKYEIIIVDNHSSEKLILNQFNNISIIRNKKNLGYSTAINIGIKNSSGKYILVLNPDVYFTNNSIHKMLSYLQTTNSTGVVGCKIVDSNDRYQKYSMRRFPGFNHIFRYLFSDKIFFLKNLYNYEDYDENKINFVDSISGCCMMFSRHAYNEIKGFNENYFLYFEDTQFCLDLKNAHYNVVYNSYAVVNHHGGGSTHELSFYYRNFLFFISFFKYLFINIYQYKFFLINCILLMLIILKFL